MSDVKTHNQPGIAIARLVEDDGSGPTPDVHRGHPIVLDALWDAMAHECVTAEAAAPKKKAAKRLRTSRAAGASVSVLRIRVPEMMREVVARDDSGGGGSHASPSLHLVRSHDHRYWVGAGDKKKLEVRHLAAYWRGSGQAGPRVTKVKGVR